METVDLKKTPAAAAAGGAAPAAAPEIKKDAPKIISVRESMGLKPKKKEDKKPDAAAPAAAAPAAVVPPKRKLAPAAAPAIALTKEEISSAVETGMKSAMKPAEAPKPKDESESLPAEMKRRHLVLKRIAKNDPTKADLPERFVASIKKLDEYKTKWESENKGQKFDIQDSSHADFVAGNDVNWDEDEYVEALADLRAEGLVAGVEKKFEGRIAEINQRERERESSPKMVAHQATAAKMMLNELGEDFTKILDEHGNINNTEIGAAIEKNPIYESVFPLVEKLEQVTSEIFRIANNLTKFDLDRNPVHREIVAFVGEMERDLSAKPEESRLDDKGRLFATSEQWEKLTPDEKKDRWTFNDVYLSALYANRQAKKAKLIIENEEKRFNKIVEKRGYKPADAGKPASPAAAATEEKPAEHVEREKTPSGVIAPRVAASGNPPDNEKKATRNKILGRG